MAYRQEQLRQTAHLSEGTHAVILDAAEETYDELAAKFTNRSRDEIHRVGLCVPASELMIA